MPCRTRLAGLEVEGWGNVFIEAAACGRPVVVGDSGGAREALVDGETGLLVDGADVDGGRGRDGDAARGPGARAGDGRGGPGSGSSERTGGRRSPSGWRRGSEAAETG